MLRFQVGEVGEAVGAADGLQVEFEVILLALVEYLEQETTERFARGAGEALAPPDRAERVVAPVALLHRLLELAAQGVGAAQRLLDARRFRLAEGVVEVGVQLFACDRGHGVAGFGQESAILIRSCRASGVKEEPTGHERRGEEWD